MKFSASKHDTKLMELAKLHNRYGRRFAVKGPEAQRALREVSLKEADAKLIARVLEENHCEGLVVQCPPGAVEAMLATHSLFATEYLERCPMLSLRQRIIDHIQENGPIPFKEYHHLTQTASAEPDKIGGYYPEGRVRFGAGEHFQTSPIIFKPYYGRALAQFAQYAWENLGRPSSFVWVEMGAGNGVVCHGFMQEVERNTCGDFQKALVYKIIEVSPALIELQRQQLEEMPVQWINASAQEAEVSIDCGVFFSNELFDDLPVHKVVQPDLHLKEIYVDVQRGEFVEVRGRLSDPEIEDYFVNSYEVRPATVPVYANLEAGRLIQKLGQNLGKGIVLTIDYGFWSEKEKNTPQTTLRYYGDRIDGKPHDAYSNVGGVNITTPVPFDILEIWGQRGGLENKLFIPEIPFLAYFCGELGQAWSIEHLGADNGSYAMLQTKNTDMAFEDVRRFYLRKVHEHRWRGWL